MYKLTILFFFLIAFNSQSLTDTYQLIFENKEATYTLQIKEGSLVFENQPGIKLKVNSANASNTDNTSNTKGKMYKITKGTTFEEGLKIGGIDIEDAAREKIGAMDIEDAAREKVGAIEVDDAIIMLSYEMLVIIEKPQNTKQVFTIDANDLFVYIERDKLILFK